MAPLLKLDRLTKYFAGLAAVKEVSFELEAGGIYGLIGPNGAGKTTLLSLIAGAQHATSGSVIFHGRNLTGRKSYHSVRAGIARTHQIPRPFSALSVLENVEVGVQFGRDREAKGGAKEAIEVLEWVGLAGVASTPASRLSVGDQKRLELARTLAARPSLLLCDEVCSGLTETEAASVLRLLGEIRKAGTTILYVEHNLKMIMAICDRVIVMNFGEKLAEGRPEEMQSDPLVIEAYIGKSAGI